MSIQLLPKLFSSFQQFVSGDQGPHWVTAWASRELNMMELFFNNITHCVETVAQGDVTSSSLYSPIEEVQARLQFLSSVFSCELSQQDFSKYTFLYCTFNVMLCRQSSRASRFSCRESYLSISLDGQGLESKSFTT